MIWVWGYFVIGLLFTAVLFLAVYGNEEPKFKKGIDPPPIACVIFWPIFILMFAALCVNIFFEHLAKRKKK